MPSSPPRQPVLVTYSSTPQLQRHVPFILNSLNTQLPLRNLHWKTTTRPTIRTIQECDLRFVNLIDAQSRGDVNWIAPEEVEFGNLFSQCPLIHICLIECEVSGIYGSIQYEHADRLFVGQRSVQGIVPTLSQYLAFINPGHAAFPKDHSSRQHGNVCQSEASRDQRRSVRHHTKRWYGEYKRGSVEQDEGGF